MNTRKNTNKKPAGLTNFQKYLTFIGSILGIITACITIYTFTAKPATSSTSPIHHPATLAPANHPATIR
ncbi:hypothetical protein PCN90_05785 [Streptococcus suis]|nr:DUF6556 family protein [Streptococcus suis]MDN2969337.1 hypothetical protein [Streptococcus suis]MDN2976736.1 hypothetical protein [Streptococcus suis]